MAFAEVRVRAECPLPEQLLCRAMQRGATFERVKRLGSRTLLIDTNASGAQTLLEICRRFSIPAKVVRRRGRIAVFDHLRRRSTLVGGLIVFALLCAQFLGRIWIIDVSFTGDEARRGDPAFFRVELNELGIQTGCPREIDVGLISEKLQACAPDYSFVGARVQGIRLLIEAAPEIPSPHVFDVEAARDLVASRDGIVLSAVARSGALCVAPGDTVRRGQLLIRGEERSAKDETRPIAAEGDVVIRTWYSGQAELPLQTEVSSYTGRCACSCRLRAFGQEWSFADTGGFSSQRVETRILPLGGLFLPIEVSRQTARETRLMTVEVDRRQLEAQLSRLALAEAARTLQLQGPTEYEVARTWTETDMPDGRTMRARAVYEIHTNAAVTRQALLQGG